MFLIWSWNSHQKNPWFLKIQGIQGAYSCSAPKAWRSLAASFSVWPKAGPSALGPARPLLGAPLPLKMYWPQEPGGNHGFPSHGAGEGKTESWVFRKIWGKVDTKSEKDAEISRSGILIVWMDVGKSQDYELTAGICPSWCLTHPWNPKPGWITLTWSWWKVQS